jgi:hypothetical protein
MYIIKHNVSCKSYLNLMTSLVRCMQLYKYIKLKINCFALQLEIENVHSHRLENIPTYYTLDKFNILAKCFLCHNIIMQNTEVNGHLISFIYFCIYEGIKIDKNRLKKCFSNIFNNIKLNF